MAWDSVVCCPSAYLTPRTSVVIQQPSADRSGATYTGSDRRKAPDYLVHFRELPVAIEVKRPASLASVQANVSQGLGQCRESARLSALALDLTDCVGMPSSVFEGSSAQAVEEATRRFREAHTEASNYIHGRKTDTGFDGCGVLWAFAGLTLWPSEEPRDPRFKLLIYGEALHHAVSGLLVEPSQWLCDRIVDGFNELGASNLAIPRRRGGLVSRLRFRGSRPT